MRSQQVRRILTEVSEMPPRGLTCDARLDCVFSLFCCPDSLKLLTLPKQKVETIGCFDLVARSHDNFHLGKLLKFLDPFKNTSWFLFEFLDFGELTTYDKLKNQGSPEGERNFFFHNSGTGAGPPMLRDDPKSIKI